MSKWTLFSNHGHVLLFLSQDPASRLRDVASNVGITERAVQKIVRDLQDAGMLSVSKHGRRNRYRIHTRKQLRHQLESHCTVGQLVELIGRSASAQRQAPDAEEKPATRSDVAEPASPPEPVQQDEAKDAEPEPKFPDTASDRDADPKPQDTAEDSGNRAHCSEPGRVGTAPMNWMLYGANGYTGRLIAAEAATRGMQPVLAGRNRGEIEALADELGLPSAVFELADSDRLSGELDSMRLVLHCAGPFSATSAPMLQACLDTHTHYLDITGEISVFEAAWQRHDDARRADVVVCPGAGFDVVPTDCLAASLVAALPAATHLCLAFEAGGGPSRGTAKTGIEGLAGGGMVRKDGELVSVPIAWKTREVQFAHAVRQVVTIPWGDVFTAWVSTGVPNIEVYYSVPPAQLSQMKLMRWLRPLLATRPAQAWLQRRVDKAPPGPDAERRNNTQSQVWGEVRSADGREVSGTLSGPNGYDFTVISSLALVAELLEREVEGGYYTPSLLMGPDFAASLPGVDMSLD